MDVDEILEVLGVEDRDDVVARAYGRYIAARVAGEPMAEFQLVGAISAMVTGRLGTQDAVLARDAQQRGKRDCRNGV
jgi:hypothetical protein